MYGSCYRDGDIRGRYVYTTQDNFYPRTIYLLINAKFDLDGEKADEYVNRGNKVKHHHFADMTGNIFFYGEVKKNNDAENADDEYVTTQLF